MVLIKDLLWFAVLVPSIFLLGHLLVRRRLARFVGSTTYLWLATSAGLLATSLFVFALGIPHVFTSRILFVALVCLWIGATLHVELRTAVFGEMRESVRALSQFLQVTWRESWFLTTILLGIVGAAFLGCGTPEVRGDPIIYHLTEAWLYVLHRGHVEIPSSALTYIPQNQQLLYALALSVGSDSLAKLFHWMQGVLLLGGTVALARRVGVSRPGSIAAATLLVACPTWFYLATTTYVDLAVANYLLCCVYLLLATRNVQESTGSMLSVAGAFVGGALGCKYTAGLVGFLPALVAWLFFSHRTLRLVWNKVLRGAIVFTAACLVIFSPWLVRNWWWTGNPVAPSFMRWLGPKGVPERTLSWPDILAVPAEPTHSPLLLLRAYVVMFLSLGKFGNLLPSLALVLGVVGTLISAARLRFWTLEVRFLLLFLTLAFLLGVPTATLRQDSRYIMAHVAILAVLIVFWYEQLAIAAAPHPHLLKRVAALVVILLIVSGIVQTYFRFQDLNETIVPIVDESARDDYCAKRLPNYLANKRLTQYCGRLNGLVLGAAYPASVPYVLGVASLRPELVEQDVSALEIRHLPGLWRAGVRYLFGVVRPELVPFLERIGESEGVTLWKITRIPENSQAGGRT
ncbi:MAG: glycosyltransferase family 39 protein [Candidatus Sumerlaeaceae bacterium]